MNETALVASLQRVCLVDPEAVTRLQARVRTADLSRRAESRRFGGDCRGEISLADEHQPRSGELVSDGGEHPDGLQRPFLLVDARREEHKGVGRGRADLLARHPGITVAQAGQVLAGRGITGVTQRVMPRREPRRRVVPTGDCPRNKQGAN